MSAVIGECPNGGLLQINERERYSGLYILGLPRVGKSWLIANLILQDIENGCGVFFIDPHYDAIQEIIYRARKKYLLFTIEDRKYSFGINLLQCEYLDDPRARNDTFTKAKGFFDKLWRVTFEEKPWLQLILQNTIHAFIENQGLTFAEFPLFYRDALFRSYICNNIKYNISVREYWLETFAAKSKHDQDEQMEAAQTRAEILLGHPYVRDIVGQAKTTVDFEKIITEKKIVLFSLPSHLSYEARKIIGTLLITELVSAIQNRSTINPEQFCIFIDEFQTFASFEDFPVLITDAPKRPRDREAVRFGHMASPLS